MKLTKDNIQEWKKAYGEYFLTNYQIDGYENVISDEDFLDYYEGETVEEAAADEISHWEP